MAIDPGPVVVDGVDDVLADHHNKQRTALLALETGTTAQTTLGTVTTGTWNAGIIPVAYGGTATATGLSPKDLITGTDGTRNRCWEDFESVAASTTDGTVYGSTLRVANALSGAASGTGATQWATDVLAGHLVTGVGQITTGTATAGKSGLYWLNNSYAFATADVLKMFARIRIPTLSDGTNTFVVRAGFMQTPNTTPTDGGFWFEANTNANWRCRVMDDSAATPDTDSTITVATTYVNLAVIYDGAGSVHFYASAVAANMTEVITAIATGLPDVGTSMHPAVQIAKSAGGTARTLNVDAFGWDLPYNRGMTQRI